MYNREERLLFREMAGVLIYLRALEIGKDVIDKWWTPPPKFSHKLFARGPVDSNCRPREDNTRPRTRLLLHPEDFMRRHRSPKHNGSVSVGDRARGAPVRRVHGFPIESTWPLLTLCGSLPNVCIYVREELAVSLQMNWLSSSHNRLKFKTSGYLPIILEESIKYTSNEWKQNRKMSTCNQLDLESLGSCPTMPKNFPSTGPHVCHKVNCVVLVLTCSVWGCWWWWQVLSFRLNVGHFPHLSDLVTRINYNYYYMTEDGQILTPIPDTHGHMSRRPARRV